MRYCFICKKDHDKKATSRCVNCGAVLCKNCIKDNDGLCPYCHSDIEND